MKKVSAVIITLNEEKNIGRCVDSLQGIVDEILVYDTGSTDRTAEICQNKNVRFLTADWLGFAATKNTANSLATFDYVLSLDADEALSQELKTSILQQKKNGFMGVYSMNRLNNYCGKWIKYAGWYPDKKVRIFPKNTQWMGDFVHETLDIGGQTVAHLKGDILHYTYYSIKEHKQRERRYAKLAYERSVHKGKPYTVFQNCLSAVASFTKMFLIKKGFLMGKLGFQLCWIASNAKMWRKV